MRNLPLLSIGAIMISLRMCLPGDWSWTRDSGQVTEDNAWSVAHANNGRVLHLTNEDMPSNWGATRKVKFTCTAYVRDGIESIKYRK